MAAITRCSRQTATRSAHQALCWAHARRKFFVLADTRPMPNATRTPCRSHPIALEAVKRIDALFDVERDINGPAADGTAATTPAEKPSSRHRT
ncbi:transposase [Mesorhizobium sp. M0174]|uniref:IS66 family transposase n=1 Tax=Mesorhizobium sp. M0174 TaxID=2956904 RepID=UPI00333CE429